MQNLPWLPGTDLRLNTATNKLESVVSIWGCCKKRPYGPWPCGLWPMALCFLPIVQIHFTRAPLSLYASC